MLKASPQVDFILTGDRLTQIYGEKISVCDLPFTRLWLMTGNTLNANVKEIAANHEFVFQQDYHEISVHLLNLSNCVSE